MRKALIYGAPHHVALPVLFRAMVDQRKQTMLLVEFQDPSAPGATKDDAADILYGRAMALSSLHRIDEAAALHPFGERTLQRETWMMFNINAYTRLLISDYLAAGGRMETVEFKSPADLLRLRQRTLVNATGYGARALFGDESVIPVRGQIARTVPQDDVRYGLFYEDVAFVPRRDGFVFQAVGDNDYYGYGDDTTIPDPAEAERAIRTIAGLFA